MRENITAFINNFIGHMAIFVIIGLLVLVFSERELLWGFFKNKKLASWKNFYPVIKRLAYILEGFLLINLSFAIVNAALNYLSPAAIPTTIATNSGMIWQFLKSQTEFTGLIATTMIILSGVCLMLSAGDKWLVNTAKILLTLTGFYLFMSTLVYFS